MIPAPSTVSQSVELAAIRITEDIAAKGWSVSDAFVSVAEVRALTDEAARLFADGEFHVAGIGTHRTGGLVPDVRRDEILWLDLEQGSAARGVYAHALELLRAALNENLCLGLLDLDVHYSVYEPGAFYKTHHDRHRGAVHRTLSCILYLNEDWNSQDGGQLRLFLEGPDVEPWVEIEPTGGRLVCFLSERFYHEVLPAKRRRLALSGWFGRRR